MEGGVQELQATQDTPQTPPPLTQQVDDIASMAMGMDLLPRLYRRRYHLVGMLVEALAETAMEGIPPVKGDLEEVQVGMEVREGVKMRSRGSWRVLIWDRLRGVELRGDGCWGLGIDVLYFVR